MSEVGKKEIYFIRHGQTLKNTSWTYQGPEEPLTDKGREQVKKAAEYLKDKNIQVLYSSPYKRALETASLIAATVGLEARELPAAREFGRPLGLYGRHHFSWSSAKYLFALWRHQLDLSWNREEAESVAHIIERVKEVKKTLEAAPEERIVVVSHKIFMALFTETLAYDKPISLFRLVALLLRRGRIPNAGILRFEVETREGKVVWRLAETDFPPYNGEVKTR